MPVQMDRWLTIVNKTGRGNDTRIVSKSGNEIGGIQKVTIHPITREDMVTATVEMMVKLDINPDEVTFKPGEK